MSPTRPLTAVAAANEHFRRGVGRDAATRGRIVFDAALKGLGARRLGRIIDAVRAFDFDDGADLCAPDRDRGAVVVDGETFAFRIRTDAAGPDASSPEGGATLTISRRP